MKTNQISTIKPLKSFFLFSFLVIMMGQLSSCSKEEIPIRKLGSMTIQADVTNPQPCPTSVSFSINAYAVNYLGYDLAIQIVPSTPPPLSNPNCYYTSCFYWLELEFPYEDVDRASYMNNPDAPEGAKVIEKDGQGGYVAHNNPVRRNTGEGPPTVIHEICYPAEGTPVALFQLGQQIPIGYDLNNMVINAGGICLVDNLPDPDQ